MGKSFGQTIKEFRIKNTELSLRKLAENIDISATYLSRIENDREPPPSEDIIIRIAQALSVDEDELLGYGNKISPDLLKTIREKPALFPNFIRSVRDFDETRLEDIMEMVQFIQSRSLRMNKSEWKNLEKIIRSLLSSNLKKQDYDTINKILQKAEKDSS